MKHLLVAVLPFLALSCASAGGGQPRAAAEPADFARLKALAGTWKGTAMAGSPEAFPVEVDYRLTGAGSAVVETLFKGTEHEMVTVYHCDGDDIVLTHYCAAGNQPRMRLATPGAKELVFEFDGGTNLDPDTDGHMHFGRLEIIDANHIKTRWSYYSGGKPDHDAQFELQRENTQRENTQREALQALGYLGGK